MKTRSASYVRFRLTFYCDPYTTTASGVSMDIRFFVSKRKDKQTHLRDIELFRHGQRER